MILDQGLRRLRGILLAPGTIIVLICLVILFCAIGILIPQTLYRGQEYYERLHVLYPRLTWFIETAGLDHIFGSIWFLAVTAVIGFALFLTVIDQFSRLIRRKKMNGIVSGEGCGVSAVIHSASETDVHDMASSIRPILMETGYRIIQFHAGNSRFSAVALKGGAGEWGMAVFHLGLLIVLLAAIWSMLFYSRGFAQIMLGETIKGAPSDWLVQDGGLLAGKLNTGFAIRLDEMKVEYWSNGQKKQIESRLTVKTANGEETSLPLSVSSPLSYKGVTIYQSMDIGYAVTIVLEPPDHRAISTDFLLKQPAQQTTLTGKMDFPTTPYVFGIKLYPDAEKPSHFLTDPVIDLTVWKDDDIQYSGRIPLGTGVLIDGNTVYFTDVRYWTGVIVITGYAIEAVIAGFIIMLSGLFLHYFIVPKYILLHMERLNVSDYRLSIFGRSPLGPTAMELDFALIQDRLKNNFHVLQN